MAPRWRQLRVLPTERRTQLASALSRAPPPLLLPPPTLPRCNSTWDPQARGGRAPQEHLWNAYPGTRSASEMVGGWWAACRTQSIALHWDFRPDNRAGVTTFCCSWDSAGTLEALLGGCCSEGVGETHFPQPDLRGEGQGPYDPPGLILDLWVS